MLVNGQSLPDNYKFLTGYVVQVWLAPIGRSILSSITAALAHLALPDAPRLAQLEAFTESPYLPHLSGEHMVCSSNTRTDIQSDLLARSVNMPIEK